MDAKLKIHSSAVLHSINVVRNTPISLSLAAAQWPSGRPYGASGLSMLIEVVQRKPHG